MTQPEFPPQDPQQPQQPQPGQPPQGGQPGQPPYGGQPGQPQYGQPGQPGAGQAPGQPPADPGKVLGIVGLVLAFFCAIVGLVISIIAFLKSRKVGATNIPAIIGMIVGVLATIAWTVGGVAIGNTAAKCAELGPGVHQEGGVTYTCG